MNMVIFLWCKCHVLGVELPLDFPLEVLHVTMVQMPFSISANLRRHHRVVVSVR